MNIAVAGMGYVGLSLAVLLSQENLVYAVDVVPEKIELLKARKSPIVDKEIECYLANKDLDLIPTLDAAAAYSNSDMVIIAAPTNYDDRENRFDTSLVEQVVESVLGANPDAVMVVKSTVPVGYTEHLCERFPEGKFLFSPEFLREGKALFDNLHPSRIIVGVPSRSTSSDQLESFAKRFSCLLSSASLELETPTLIMPSTEAEAVKLFANTYLALRVSYFNELDTYAALRGLDARQIIQGVSLDPRIGSHYNNPSFGYGGYCLPKDTKQLLANYAGVPQKLIKAIVESNSTRKDYVANEVIGRVEALVREGTKAPTVGVYRLIMKAGSDNFRSSSIQDVAMRVKAEGISLVVYEPAFADDDYCGSKVLRDLTLFKDSCDLIIANRWSDDLLDVKSKVYTCDLFGRD